jgi:predicted Zn-dependent protease
MQLPRFAALGRWARAVAPALLLLACATSVNPVTGERETLVVSPEQEAAAGRQAAEQVRQQMGLVEDPELQAYVEELGRRLAARSPGQNEYRFAIVDMEEPNAFALPGGWIYVSRGLLALANSEDALANVLAHEIGHVAARHHAQRQTRATGVGVATILGTLAAAVLGGPSAAQAVGAIGQSAGAGLIASYSRDQERQSDEIGQQLAASAGYDPMGMATFLRSLERYERHRLGEAREPTFLDSHPSTPERVAAAQERAEQWVGRPAGMPVASDRRAFLAQLDGLAVGPDPAEGVVRGETFLHPDLDLFVRFPSGWTVVNAPQAVMAGAPERDAALALTLQGRGDDPRRAAEEFAARAQGVALRDLGATRVNGLAAERARVEAEQAVVELTWIAHAGSIYRFEAAAVPRRFDAYLDRLRAAVESFRPLAAEERASIRERELRVVEARAGETLETLSRRTDNAWSPEETAIMNDLDAAQDLGSGIAVKVAREQPYPAR